MPPKGQGQKPGAQNGASGKPRALKSIQKTEDLLRNNAHAKRRGQGKERLVLKGLHELVKGKPSSTLSIMDIVLTAKLVTAFLGPCPWRGSLRYAHRLMLKSLISKTRALEIAALQNAMKVAA